MGKEPETPKQKTVLVTGGAGYIGSHVVRMLGEAGHAVVVLDDLSTGNREAVLAGDLIVGDVGDELLLDSVLRDYRVDTVMHFAARTVVPDSVTHPLDYYLNNTCKSHALLVACNKARIRSFVFSSTAAVYGIPDNAADVTESTATRPINPYGTSKLMTELMLQDLAAASDLRYVSLRYFNVAGADLATRIGQSTLNATHLIKVACEAAVRKRASVTIFGTDYPTPDGTGVRDYIHVEDLASAHLKALDYLNGEGSSLTLNCGYGHGYSVREVLAAVERVSAVRLEITEAPRRAGDPPILVAQADRIRRTLAWAPKYDDLDFIVKTALRWEQHLKARDSTTA